MASSYSPALEILGNLILEELRLMRKDVRDEVKQVSLEIKELCELHKSAIKKFNEKSFGGDNVNMSSRQSSLIGSVSESFDGEYSSEPIGFLKKHLEKIEENNNCDTINQNHLSLRKESPGSPLPSFPAEETRFLVKKEMNLTDCEFSQCVENSAISTNFNVTAVSSLEPNFSVCDDNLTQSKSSTSNSFSLCNSLLAKDECDSTNSTSKKAMPQNRIKLSSTENDFQLQSTFGSFDSDNTENFRCQFCQKPFHHYSRYVSHLRTHTGEKPFACSLCNKSFAAKGNLKKHMILHNDKKPFVCYICNQGFAQKRSLRIHLARHNNHQIFKCDICNKSFKQLAHLIAHKEIHSL